MSTYVSVCASIMVMISVAFSIVSAVKYHEGNDNRDVVIFMIITVITGFWAGWGYWLVANAS